MKKFKRSHKNLLLGLLYNINLENDSYYTKIKITQYFYNNNLNFENNFS